MGKRIAWGAEVDERDLSYNTSDAASAEPEPRRLMEDPVEPVPNRPKANPNRLSVNLSQDVADALRSIVVRNKITITEAIRRAISLLKFVDDLKEGEKLLIARRGERPRELVFFR